MATRLDATVVTPRLGDKPAPSEKPATEENDPTQHEALREVAEQRTDFVRADGSWWSPLDCRAPPPDPARRSRAPEDTSHGQKIYTLHIFDVEGYAKDTKAVFEKDSVGRRRLVTSPSGTTQAIVKASYAPTTDPEEATPMIAPVKSADGTLAGSTGRSPRTERQ